MRGHWWSRSTVWWVCWVSIPFLAHDEPEIDGFDQPEEEWNKVMMMMMMMVMVMVMVMRTLRVSFKSLALTATCLCRGRVNNLLGFLLPNLWDPLWVGRALCSCNVPIQLTRTFVGRFECKIVKSDTERKTSKVTLFFQIAYLPFFFFSLSLVLPTRSLFLEKLKFVISFGVSFFFFDNQCTSLYQKKGKPGLGSRH